MKSNSILIVDDEPNNFEVIETLIDDDDCELYYAHSGTEALATLDAYQPDVILLDLTMPDMDGLEFCQQIKLRRQWKSVPIIMVTAASGNDVLSQCLAAGADDFISKPVDRVELNARIKSMLRIKKQFDRIESLAKLQQKNINSLASGFDELGDELSEIATGLSSELNIPLNIIVEQLRYISQNINRLKRSQILHLVNSSSQSALKLEKLIKKLWLYLEIYPEKKQVDRGDICEIKGTIEQIAAIQSKLFDREGDIFIEIEPTKVAISDRHCQLLMAEILDWAFNSSNSGVVIRISGGIIGKYFQLWASKLSTDDFQPVAGFRPECRIFNTQELELSLKIIKKLVDIYDGVFSICDLDRQTLSGTDLEHSTIQISLPLA